MEFLAENGLSTAQLVEALGVVPKRISEIVRNRRWISAKTAERLALLFGNSPEFWMNLQSNDDPERVRRTVAPEEAARSAAGSALFGVTG